MSRIQHIANDLLERPRTTKSDNPKVDGAPTARVQICLSQILDSIVAEKQFQYSANSSLVFEFSSDSNVEREVPVNPEELKRALSNLLNNAAEACNFDGKIKIFVRHYTNEIVITVLDSGRGIPPEIMNQLGTRGFSHGKLGGSGFGLSHTKAFVEKAGGKLLIQSRVGEGTMISISLPSPRLFV
jgi:signal transduction histidine kinase